MKSRGYSGKAWGIWVTLAVLAVAGGAANGEITTVTYQVSAGPDDGFAQSATVQDTAAAYLKIGDEHAYTVPYQMSAMRFTNVNIPRSATITSAYLKISSINTDYRGQIYGVIAAEASDNPADFSSRMIGDAALTTTSVAWDFKDAWSPDTQYISPDISNVVQEVVNRSGFSSGNSIAIYYSTRDLSGKGRSFASYEYSPSSAAVLEITYEAYTISGYVKTSDATAIEGVSVSAGSDIEGDVTDASGYYELKVPLGWSGTVTPNHADWGFNPTLRVYTSATPVNSDKPDQDFIAFKPVISGYINDLSGAPIEGVQVLTYGASGASAVSDSNGYYEVSVPWGWGGPVWVSKAGWDFDPHTRWYSLVSVDISDQNVTGSPKDPERIYVESATLGPTGQSGGYLLSGAQFIGVRFYVPYRTKITAIGGHLVNHSGNLFAAIVELDYQTGRPVGSPFNPDDIITSTIINPSSGSEDLRIPVDAALLSHKKYAVIFGSEALGSTGGDGRMPFSGQQNLGHEYILWNGSGWYNAIVDQNKAPRFVVEGYDEVTISGNISTSDGVGLEGVNLQAGTVNTTTDAQGDYQITIGYNWSGTVVPSKAGWSFLPLERSYSSLQDDVSNEDYTAYPPPVISGHITDDPGMPAEGVTVSADNGGGTGETDSSGYYELEVPYGWGGTITPLKAGWSFNPLTMSFSNVTGDISDADFTLKVRPIISGYITDTAGAMVEGVTVSPDDGSATAVTDSNGEYQLSVEYNWSGVVIPTKTSLSFYPYHREYTELITEEPNQNYVGYPAQSNGSGTAEDPFLIYTAVHMNSIGTERNDWDKHFKLMQDIDLSGFYDGEFNLIGDESAPFTGVFDGNSMTLYNFYSVASSDYTGLFRYVSGPNTTIKDLILKYPGINSTGFSIAGSLVGKLSNDATISGCSAEEGVVVGDYSVGGLVGENSGVITNCNTSNITGITSSYSDYWRTGGLVGFNQGTISSSFSSGDVYGNYASGGLVGFNAGIISSSYATGQVVAKEDYFGHRDDYVGGLVGYNDNDAEITNCYSTGNAMGGDYVGGLVGTNNNGAQIIHSYSTGSAQSDDPFGGDYLGGLVGGNSGAVTVCFWNIETSGTATSAGGTGKTTSQMQTKDTYASTGWDFDNIWGICEGYTYPRLSMENVVGIEILPSILSFSALLDRPDPNSQTLSINNSFYGLLHWNIDINGVCGWLDINPTTGISTHNTDTINVSVDTSSLVKGNYDCLIILSDPNALNSPQVIEVYLELLGPSLGISQDTFNFQATKETLIVPDQILSIVNQTGGGILDWQISVPNDCNWLKINPIQGKCTTEPNTVSLSIDVNYVDYGSYSCQVTVSDPNAENSPQIVTVNLDVLRPDLAVSPVQFYFETTMDEPNDSNQVLAIQNVGYDTLYWDIDVPSDCNWIQFSSMSGNSTGEADEVILIIDQNEVEPGFYNFDITVSAPYANNSPQVITVELRVLSKTGERHVPAEYQTIQAAIDAAVNGDEVIIHPGTYMWPDNHINFLGKAITVRSIDPENPVVVFSTVMQGGYFRFNSGEGSDSVLAGLRFVGNICPPITCTDSSPVINNCIFENSNLVECRQGMIILNGSCARISNCTIRNNINYPLLGPVGMITVVNNQDSGCSAIIENCLIAENFGTGIYVNHGAAEIRNCTIVENQSSWGMGWPAVVFDYDGTSTILNSILWDNVADGNQIILSHDVDSSTPTTVTIGYCDIQAGQSSVSVGSGSTLNWGDGNIDVDPCFAEPGYWHPNDTPLDTNDDFLINGDYHLKSEAGRWEWSELIRLDSTGDGFIDFLDLSNFASYWKHTRNSVIVYDWWQKVYPYVPADLDASGIVDFADLGLLLDSYLSDYNIGQWVKDDVTSPCIDAGDPNSDWTEELWPNGHRINMGAYGGTRQASMSLSTLGNIADLNGDDVVNFRDYAWFAELWEVTGMLLAEDLDRNGAVNSIDAGVFVDNWLWEQ